MPLQSHLPCASIRQKGRPEPACLDACSSLSELGCSRSDPALEKDEASGAIAVGGGSLGPRLLGGQAEGGGAVDILLWGEDRGTSPSLVVGCCRSTVLGLGLARQLLPLSN